MMKKASAVFCCSFFLFVFSCSTFSASNFDGLSENDVFNKIQLSQQKASTKTQYNDIIASYQYYISNFDSRLDRVMEARYEIAYINYYLKNYDAADADFRSIISEYENGGSSYTMQWIYVLSVKLRDEITKIKTEKILAAEKKSAKKL